MKAQLQIKANGHNGKNILLMLDEEHLKLISVAMIWRSENLGAHFD